MLGLLVAYLILKLPIDVDMSQKGHFPGMNEGMWLEMNFHAEIIQRWNKVLLKIFQVDN